MIIKSPRLTPLASLLLGLAATDAHAAEKAGMIFHSIQFEEFEYRASDDSDLITWDGEAYIGKDEGKIYLRSTAEYAVQEQVFERLEHQLFYQLPVSGFFDLTAGLRYDNPTGRDRAYGLVGLRGLAPQWIETELTLYVSEQGIASSRLEAGYQLLLTQKLKLNPSLELNHGFADDKASGLGSGLRDMELGLRLSYDLLGRALAPYLGVIWEKSYGETADFSRADGGDVETFFVSAGFSWQF